MDRNLLRRSIGDLCAQASAIRDCGKARIVSYSPKVFIPLTRLCRNACGYCDFRNDEASDEAFLSLEQVLTLARTGERAGCTEALLISGDKPEATDETARAWLARRGWKSTADYAYEAARLILGETRLYPHTNSGIANDLELEKLREVNASLGLMLETTSERLGRSSGPHASSPDKRPRCRLEFLARAGQMKIPTTTGLLVGIGETRAERMEALSAIKNLQDCYGHIQEVIVQNFRPKQGTAMENWPAPSLDEMLWTTAVARVILGPEMNLQVPPNLVAPLFSTPGARSGVSSRSSAVLRSFGVFLDAGINDWGGVSPVTRDGVNREAPWPTLERLRHETESRGFRLRARFPVYPEFIEKPGFVPPALAARLSQDRDQDGYVREVSLG